MDLVTPTNRSFRTRARDAYSYTGGKVTHQIYLQSLQPEPVASSSYYIYSPYTGFSISILDLSNQAHWFSRSGGPLHVFNPQKDSDFQIHTCTVPEKAVSDGDSHMAQSRCLKSRFLYWTSCTSTAYCICTAHSNHGSQRRHDSCILQCR